MIRKAIILSIIVLLFLSKSSFAFWVWTSDSGKWENPKYKAKDTPKEQLEYSISFYKEKNYKVALREVKKLIKYYPLSKEAPTAQYYIGRIMEDMGNPYEGFKAYQKVIDLYPHTEFVDEVIERQFNIGDGFFKGEKYQVLGPLKVPAKDKAIEIFKTVSESAPYGKYADISIFNAGLAYKDIADYKNAILMFKELLDRYPDSKYLDDARYRLAESSKLLSLDPDYDQTPTIVAREEFEDFIKKHPESDLSNEAKEIVDKLKGKEAESMFNTGMFYESRHMQDSAVIYYSDIVKSYPGTEWAKKANERLNEINKK
ncbi:MAG: outer membrane protein assembly factor BamD [Candidatus Omnitrophota bacterium]